jgi:hypothetical protein
VFLDLVDEPDGHGWQRLRRRCHHLDGRRGFDDDEHHHDHDHDDDDHDDDHHVAGDHDDDIDGAALGRAARAAR